MLVNQRDHLDLFPAEEWAAFEQRLLDSSSLNPEAQRLRRFYASGSVPCPVDQQGRILVPGFLREHANLESKVIVAGAFEHVEIWSPAKFESSYAETLHGLDDYQRIVDETARS